MRCEDYPCCGHGPPPMGDGAGCPDSEGRFNCCECGDKLERKATSAICSKCRGEYDRNGWPGGDDLDNERDERANWTEQQWEQEF